MKRSALSLAVLLAFGATAGAARAQSTPSAGDVLRQSTPAVPAQPAPALPSIGNLPPPPLTRLPSGGQAVAVKSITVEGNRVIDTATLQAEVADAQGQTLTLAQMEEVATRLTASTGPRATSWPAPMCRPRT